MAKWSSEMRGMNPVKWWSFHGWSKTGPEKWWENSHQIGSLWSCTGLVLGTNLANELVPHQECPVGQNRGPGAGIPSIIIYLLLTSINSLYHCWYTPMKNHLPLYTSSISSIPSLGKHSPLSTSRGTTWSAASILMDPEMSRTQMMSTGTRSPCAWRRGFLALLGKNTPENPKKPMGKSMVSGEDFPQETNPSKRLQFSSEDHLLNYENYDFNCDVIFISWLWIIKTVLSTGFLLSKSALWRI